jgi:hypothetical protein
LAAVFAAGLAAALTAPGFAATGFAATRAPAFAAAFTGTDLVVLLALPVVAAVLAFLGALFAGAATAFARVDAAAAAPVAGTGFLVIGYSTA